MSEPHPTTATGIARYRDRAIWQAIDASLWRAATRWRIGHHYRLPTFRQLPGVVAMTAARQAAAGGLHIWGNRFEWWHASEGAGVPTAEDWRRAYGMVGVDLAEPGGDRTAVTLVDFSQCTADRGGICPCANCSLSRYRARYEHHRRQALNRDLYPEYDVSDDATLRIRLYKCSSEWAHSHPGENIEQVGPDFFYVTAPLAEALVWYRDSRR